MTDNTPERKAITGHVPSDMNDAGHQPPIRLVLCHEDGSRDTLTVLSDAPVPRVGEFVSTNRLANGYVFDVNYVYRPDERYVSVCIACDGGQPGCDRDCTREHRDQYAKR